MNHSKNEEPPRRALAFFRWFCKPEFREDIEGDLLETFHNRVTRLGTQKAKWLFVKDVLLLFRPGIIANLKTGSKQKLDNMKAVNWKKLIGLNLLAALMILSPFMPGPSNNLVHVFSFAGQVTAFIGLILIPVGLTWAIFEIRKMRKSGEKPINQQVNYRISIAVALFTAFIFLVGVIFLPNPQPKMIFFFAFALVLTGFILAKQHIRNWEGKNGQSYDHGASIILASSAAACITFISLGSLLFVFTSLGIVSGIIALILISGGLFWIIRQIRNLMETGKTKFNRVPLYLLTIPLIAFLTHMFIREPASGFSRNFAIKRSEVLITSIEDYKNRMGQYPASMEDLDSPTSKKILKPFIMGIDKFRYNKINDRYSISFSQWPDLGLEEIVLYDKNDLKSNLTGEFAKYNYSLDLCRIKGAFANYDTRHTNWRYYHVD